MTSKKLPLLFGLALGALSTMACAPLGQYGALGTPAPGAAGPAATPAATPGTATGSPLASETSPSSAPAAAQSVSVTIRNSCGQNVKVFYGDKPKFGSGTYSSSSSNSISSHTFRPGDQFWIVDDSQNGIANVQVAEGTREIEIVGACDRLASR